jgi:hypothetical protein
LHWLRLVTSNGELNSKAQGRKRVNLKENRRNHKQNRSTYESQNYQEKRAQRERIALVVFTSIGGRNEELNKS